MRRLCLSVQPHLSSLSLSVSSRRQLAQAALPAVVDCADERSLGTLLSTSGDTPVVLLLHLAGDVRCESWMRSIGAAAAAPGARFRLGLVEVKELPQVAEALRVSQVPTLVAMRRGKVVKSLGSSSSDTAVAAFLREVGEVVVEAGVMAAADAEAQLACGLAALTGLPSAEAAKTAATALSAVLTPESGSGPALRARALAGLCRVALASTPPDLGTARELAAAARAAADSMQPVAAPGGQAAGPVPSPPEVAAAEAFVALFDSWEATRDAPADDPPAMLRHDALRLCCAEQNLPAALEAAMLLVRRHRAWRSEEARALVVRLLDALCMTSAEGAAKGRRRLANLLFA
jgi:thioredoxin-like negative regulator of GroEL